MWGREFSGNVYQTGNRFPFTLPVEGTAAASQALFPLPRGATFSGYCHTHGAYSPDFYNEEFSPTDWNIAMGLAQSAGLPRGVSFLGTPAGRVEILTPGKIYPPFENGCVAVGTPVPAELTQAGVGIPQC